MLGGGGIAEHDGSVVTGGGGTDWINGLYWNGSNYTCKPAPYSIGDGVTDGCDPNAYGLGANYIAPFVLDPRKCISYLTIELRGPMPEEQREGVGEHLFGCDACQDVCPYNRTAGETKPRYLPHERWNETSLEALTQLDDAAYEALVTGSPTKRSTKAGLARNAVTVLANRG